VPKTVEFGAISVAKRYQIDEKAHHKTEEKTWGK
jgi:hypothetical protein